MDEAVVARFVRDDGAELVADETDWGLTKIEGADAPKLQIFTEDNAVGDGSTVTGKKVSERDLQIEAEVMDAAQNDALRWRATEFFNPKRTYKVYLTYMGRTRWIEGELSAFKAPTGFIHDKQSFSAYFLCPNPYWQSVDDFGQDIASETARWGFPYMDNPDYGVLVSYYNYDRKVVFQYPGDVPAYPSAILQAEGQVTNPKLIKDDAYIRILDTMEAGDVIEIVFFPYVRVRKNGENILNKVDRTSNFAGMQMQPGINTVSYAADFGDNSLHVILRYNNQYLGV